MPTNKVSLDAVVARGDVTLGPEEHPDERTARLKRENRAAIKEDVKDYLLFAALFLFLLGMAVICVYLIIFAKNASSETERWAQSILTGISTGTVSFFAGRKIGK